MKIIGVAGLPRSGKDTLAELLIKKGWFGVSLGDIVRDESRIRHADKPDPISVANMTETSNYLRTTKGPDFALKEAIARYQAAQARGENHPGLVVYSVRAPIEADFILKNGGSLMWVEASDEIRHQRFRRYRREGEAEITLEAMKAQEALQEKPQLSLPAEVQMNIAYVKSKAGETLENNGNDLAAFEAKIEAVLRQHDLIS